MALHQPCHISCMIYILLSECAGCQVNTGTPKHPCLHPDQCRLAAVAAVAPGWSSAQQAGHSCGQGGARQSCPREAAVGHLPSGSLGMHCNPGCLPGRKLMYDQLICMSTTVLLGTANVCSGTQHQRLQIGEVMITQAGLDVQACLALLLSRPVLLL